MPKVNEISLTRVYDAPVELVWDAWNDPKKAAKWWGPRGWSIKTHSKDLRPGGHWAYTMFGPQGEVFENKTLYHEVEPNRKLVYDHGGNDDRPPLFRVTVTFEAVKNKTVMVMIMALESPEAAKQIKGFIKQASGNSTWDRLGEYLGDEAGKHKFIINRAFETTPAAMFKVWTDPAHFSKWLPPVGFTMHISKGEIKAGSAIEYSMTNGEFTMSGRISYHEISPAMIRYTMEFLDDKGNLTRHPALKVFPANLLHTVTIVEEEPGITRVTVETQSGAGSSSEEVMAFMDLRTSMTGGWTGSFDKLEELLQ